MASQAPLLDVSEPGSQDAFRRGLSKTLRAVLAGLAAGAACGIVMVASPPGVALRDEVAPTSLRAAPPIWTPDQPGAWEGKAYEAMIEFHIPYFDFAEQIYVHSDPPNGHMRLSYYNGADVFLVNTTGQSYELVPVGAYESCLVTGAVDHLELVISDLDTFRKHGYYNKVSIPNGNGGESVGYEFILDLTSPHVSNDAHWTYGVPVDNYVGKYVFLVDATAGGHPVSMTFRGRNPFLIGSHSDEYQLVYKAFHPRPDGIDRTFFLPPQGMRCTPYENPVGPFTTGGGSHGKRPLRDFAMAMPGMRGDSHRQSILREMGNNFGKECSGFDDCGHRQRLALRHFRYVQAVNRRGGHYKLGVNHMLDWSAQERLRILGRKQVRMDSTPNLCGEWEPDYSTLLRPVAYDAREHGLVGRPRDQGTCGSCWSFGTIGSIEGQLAKKEGKITRMSEQHLLDCSWGFGNSACDGGLDYHGLSWALAKNGGQLPTAASYGTYLSENGFCHFSASDNIFGLAGVPVPPPGATEKIEVGAVIKSCWHVPGPQVGDGNEAAAARMEYALANIGPVSISLGASATDFYYYESGVYDGDDCGGNDPDSLGHTVLATGYGTSAWGEKYWWLRNSWSTTWGEEGYIRVTQKDNTCGIAFQGIFALLV